MKMDIINSTEMLVILYETTRRHVPEDSTFYSHSHGISSLTCYTCCIEHHCAFPWFQNQRLALRPAIKTQIIFRFISVQQENAATVV
jgi:hypothetical protein